MSSLGARVSLPQRHSSWLCLHSRTQCRQYKDWLPDANHYEARQSCPAHWGTGNSQDSHDQGTCLFVISRIIFCYKWFPGFLVYNAYLKTWNWTGVKVHSDFHCLAKYRTLKWILTKLCNPNLPTGLHEQIWPRNTFEQKLKLLLGHSAWHVPADYWELHRQTHGHHLWTSRWEEDDCLYWRHQHASYQWMGWSGEESHATSWLNLLKIYPFCQFLWAHYV